MIRFREDNQSTPWRLILGLPLLAILIGGVIWLARPSQPITEPTSGLSVVAAENFWGNIASQLGGQYVNVTSIISNPNADPHLYESSAQDAAAVAKAKVVIVNGLGYDNFMTKLVGASTANQQVVTVADVLGITDKGTNEHFWYDLPQINKIAAKITASLETVDPAHQLAYQQNLASFEQSMQPLLQTLAQIKQRYGGTPVAYTEPVPAYLLQAAGLDIVTPAGFAKSIEDGDEPSPADTQAMDNLITSHGIKVLLYNSQATSAVTEHAKALAAQAGVPVIGVTETMPAGASSYQDWQQNQLDQLLKALETN